MKCPSLRYKRRKKRLDVIDGRSFQLCFSSWTPSVVDSPSTSHVRESAYIWQEVYGHLEDPVECWNDHPWWWIMRAARNSPSLLHRPTKSMGSSTNSRHFSEHSARVRELQAHCLCHFYQYQQERGQKNCEYAMQMVEGDLSPATSAHETRRHSMKRCIRNILRQT